MAIGRAAIGPAAAERDREREEDGADLEAAIRAAGSTFEQVAAAWGLADATIVREIRAGRRPLTPRRIKALPRRVYNALTAIWRPEAPESVAAPLTLEEHALAAGASTGEALSWARRANADKKVELHERIEGRPLVAQARDSLDLWERALVLEIAADIAARKGR